MPLDKSLKAISFNYLKPVAFRQRTKIKSMVVRILKSAALKPQAINYVFCSDEYLREMNRTHLNHDYYTDIITFDLSSEPRQTVADIYISVDRVKDNARGLKHSFEEELRRVIFHGALHLAGYKDKSAGDQQKMRAQEEKYLRLFHRTV